ncbi:MAG: protein-disulfide reductase DsbD domain-containing protein [Pyrinomonadaceae bacterium]
MKKLTFAMLMVSLIVGCRRTAQMNSVATANSESRAIASVNVVKATPEQATIDGGGSADAIVRLVINKGYHLNANPPTYPYLKATELEITPAGGISVDFISYPNAIAKKFPFAENPLAVYEGDTTLEVRLKAATGTARGPQNLRAKLRVQACDDQVCYAPGTLDLVIPVNVQ